MKKKEWDRKRIFEEVDRILKQGTLLGKLEEFTQRMEQVEITAVPEDWQNVFDSLFDSMLEEHPVFACCILAFQMGQVWQKYYGGKLCQ